MFRVTFLKKNEAGSNQFIHCFRLDIDDKFYYVYTNGQDLPCKVNRDVWELQGVQLQE